MTDKIYHGFPFDNTGVEIQDRNVASDVFAMVLHQLNNKKSGLYLPIGNSGAVLAGAGMMVNVLALNCALLGRQWDTKSTRELIVQASESRDRIDTIILRLDLVDRSIDLYVLKGVADTIPLPPNLTRMGDLYEVGLANVFIPKLSTQITQDKIQDTRLNAERMELIPVVGDVDLTSIYNQYQAALDEYLDLVATALDGTTAGHLQNQITTMEGEIINIPLASWVDCTTDPRYTKQFTTTTVNNYPGGIKDIARYHQGGAMSDELMAEHGKLAPNHDYDDETDELVIFATEPLTKDISLRI